MANVPRVPYVLLASLGWGRLGCLERGPGGRVTAATRPLAAELKVRPTQLQSALKFLEARGLVHAVRWYGGWFSCQLDAPVGFAADSGAVLDVEVSSGPATR